VVKTEDGTQTSQAKPGKSGSSEKAKKS
jgi:hypothetical protein